MTIKYERIMRTNLYEVQGVNHLQYFRISSVILKNSTNSTIPEVILGHLCKKNSDLRHIFEKVIPDLRLK